MPIELLLPKKIKSSRRMRRVAWTISGLISLLLIGAVVTWRIQKEKEPKSMFPASPLTTSPACSVNGPPNRLQSRQKPLLTLPLRGVSTLCSIQGESFREALRSLSLPM
jgi:hypothetical protein